MNLVWNSTLEGPSKRFVLLALADTADDKGKCIALGVPTLCRKTGIKRSTMFGLLRDLEQVDNLILREEQARANRSRTVSRFWINLPLLKEMQLPDEEQAGPFGVPAGQPPVQILDGGPVDNSITPVQNLDPQPVQNLDGARPDLGPLNPSSFSDTDPDGRRSPATSEHDTTHAVAAGIVGALDLRKCDPSPKQVGQIAAAVTAALVRGVPADVVAEHAQRKSREAETVKYFIRAFSEEHLSVDAVPIRPTSRLPPVCGQCNAIESDPVSARVVWLDAERNRSRWCPRCHPKAAAAAS